MTTTSGDNPLSYIGINRKEQPRFLSFNRAPTVNDYQSFEIGDQWNDTSVNPPNIYILKSVDGNQGIWQVLGSSTTTFPVGVLTGDGTSTVAGSTVTNSAPVIGDASNKVKTTAAMNNGEVLIGSTGSDPVPASLTAGSNITITPGAGSITIDSTASGGITTVPTDGSAAAPAAGSLTLAGGTGIKTSGSGSTVTTSLDTPVSVPNGGTGASTLTDGGILLGSGTGAVTPTSQMTNGQVLIGSTGADPVPAELTAGAGISITPGAGSISIASTAGGSKILKYEYIVVTTQYTTTSHIPIDNTPPISSEGGAAMSITFTPQSSTSNLIINVGGFCSLAAGADGGTVALFNNAASSQALVAYTVNGGGPDSGTFAIVHAEPSSTTSTRTYSVRFGPSAAGKNMGLNASSAGNASYGSSTKAYIAVTEIET